MIHVACNIDSRYVRYCAVTLVSLFENNPGKEFTIHIITRELAHSEKEVLIQLAAKYNNHVCYYELDSSLMEGFTIRATHNRISLATYYRCFLSGILPADIDRLLYLDCDILVLGDISPLWETPMDDKTAIAAVEDMGCRESQRYDTLQYPQSYSYFNAGMMLINLAYWREHDIARSCLDYYHTYPERIVFNDQDLLNSVLYRNKKLLDVRWNMQEGFYRNLPSVDEEWRKQHVDALLHPVILHFTNRKPWDYDSQHPFKEVYFHYEDLTPWKGKRALKNPFNLLKRFFRLLPFWLHIRKPKYIKLDQLRK